LEHLEEFTRVRQANASALLRGLRGVAGVQTIAPARSAIPVYLRLPILVEDAQTRGRVLAALTAVGIGASGSYPASLVDVPALRAVIGRSISSADAGRSVAERIVTLPTHVFMKASDIARTIEAIAGALARAPSRRTSPAA
jgi:dTDP-4-amino-4,6-dideoxygalactose transaminase